MPRSPRVAVGGIVYHVLNRANAKMTIFGADGDYHAFEDILDSARQRTGTRLLAYCVMPNHWHLVVWPLAEGELSEFVRWLTLTHTQRWHAYRESAGSGHVYQGRFKSFPVESDEHLFAVCRYVERNPLRAGLVRAAEDWRWSSLWRRVHGNGAQRALLSDWPIAPPRGWVRLVNEPQTQAELAAVREAVQRGRPYGEESWLHRTAARLGLELTLRPRGRPRLAARIAGKGS
jgi:putative transposase